MNKSLLSFLLLIVLLLGGAFGYVLIEQSTFLDGLYMTVITITTVGYGEVMPLSPQGKYFTMVLMLTGVSFVLYLFSRVTEAVVEGGLRRVFGRINMDKKLARLEGHYIVCGFGRIGKVICDSLKENDRSFVIIENDPQEIKNITKQDFMFIDGDASDDDTLVRAGVRKAKGLIAVVSSDADNVYIVLSAKELNPKLFVLVRSSGKEGADIKLMRAGADKVISPYLIGARQMANMILRPTVIDFLDLAVHHQAMGLRMEEIVVPANATIVNKTLMDSEIRKNFDLIVVAIKREDKEMTFNPSHLTVIGANDTIIVLGETSSIQNFEKTLALA